MRTLLTLAACAMMFITPLFAQSDSTTSAPAKREVVFDSTMNKPALDQLKKELRPQGIILMFDDLKFGPRQQLQRISFTVMDATGNEQKASNDDVSVGWVFGFVYENVDGKNTVTRIGLLRPPDAKPEPEKGKKKKKDKKE
jgi:hypothetical protein